MARLFANENLPEPVVRKLRRLGPETMTMRESGHAGRAVPDAEVLDFATAQRRAVVTLNRLPKMGKTKNNAEFPVVDDGGQVGLDAPSPGRRTRHRRALTPRAETESEGIGWA